jgi:hypothetical protein
MLLDIKRITKEHLIGRLSFYRTQRQEQICPSGADRCFLILRRPAAVAANSFLDTDYDVTTCELSAVSARLLYLIYSFSRRH